MSLPLLSYRLSGQPGKQPLLFLHGFMGCGDDWDELAVKFSNDHAIITVDLPGHGDSYPLCEKAAAARHYSMSGCAELIISLLDHLSLVRPHVIGYSMGGRLALYLATHHADRFGRFVVESASPGLNSEREREERRLRDQQLADTLRTEALDDFLEFWYDQPLFDTLDRTSDGFLRLLERRRRGNPEGYARSLEHMGIGRQPSLWDKLPEINTPILFLAGEKDHKFNRLADEMAHLCPHGQLAIIAGAGHNVHVEQPGPYYEQLAGFLKR